MTQLKFDETGSRKFEAGVDHAVLYVVDKVTKKYGKGVAWNGIELDQEYINARAYSLYRQYQPKEYIKTIFKIPILLI